MRIPFGQSAYEWDEYGLPDIALENWFVRPYGGLNQNRLIPTPGLVSTRQAEQTIRGAAQADGLVGDKIVYVINNIVRTQAEDGADTNIDNLVSDVYRAEFAPSQTHLVVVSGGNAYTVTDSAVTGISMPSGFTGDVTSVAELGQRHLYVEDQSGRFWWSAPGDPTDISGTNFATAEAEPDNLVAIRTYRGLVYLFGTKIVEVWTQTGDSTNAFVSTGRTIPNGLIGRNAVTVSDDAVFMVANSGQVLRIDGTQRQRVSTYWLESVIKGLSKANQQRVSLSTFQWQGHEFIRVNVPGVGNWNYDLTTGFWHRARSLRQDTHRVSDFVNAFGKTYAFGDGVYTLSATTFKEHNDEVRRVAEAIIPVDDRRPSIDRLTIYTSASNVPMFGQGSAPVAWLQIATDTQRFSNEIERSLPIAGEYAQPIVWGPLGRVRPPAAKIRLAMSDPMGITLADAQINMVQP